MHRPGNFDKLSSVTTLDEPDTSTPDGTCSFTLNGTPVSVRGRHPHLLSALREELDVTSPKDGCSPSGQCGCCTVLIDGEPIRSCVTFLGDVRDKEVLTIEGLAGDGELHPLQLTRFTRQPA